MPRISCVDSRETESLKVHQKNNGFFGSRYFLFKTEGLGMASIRIANCMELPVGRMASRPGVYPLWCCSFLYSRLFYALITPRVSWKVLPLRTAAFIFSAKAELEYAYLRLISFVSQRNMYLRSAFESSFLAR